MNGLIFDVDGVIADKLSQADRIIASLEEVSLSDLATLGK